MLKLDFLATGCYALINKETIPFDFFGLFFRLGRQISQINMRLALAS
jgi:hypothetical protein